MKLRKATMVLGLPLILIPPAFAEQDAANLLQNAGFESPAGKEGLAPQGWEFFTSRMNMAGISRKEFRTGNQSLELRAQEFVGADMGCLQHLLVTAGTRYTFSAYVRNSRTAALDGTFFGILSIEWLDAAGKEIGRSESPPWMRDLSQMRWTPVSVVAKAPPLATQAKFVIHAHDGNGKVSHGSCYVDDVLVTAEDPAPVKASKSGGPRSDSAPGPAGYRSNTATTAFRN